MHHPLTKLVLVSAACGLLISACDGGPAPAPPMEASVATTQPQATANAIHPTATLADGSVLELELAITPEEIQNGLMFRPSLPSDRGMLFVFGHERLPSFWMKNTLIPLDIIFLDPEGTVVDVVRNAQPCKVDPCPQYVPKHPAAAVLEINAGRAAELGLDVGVRIEFSGVADYPAR